VAAKSWRSFPCPRRNVRAVTDLSRVRGTHGRLSGGDGAGPEFLCSDRRLQRDRIAATDVKGLCLRLIGG